MQLQPATGATEGRLLAALDLAGISVLSLARDRAYLAFLSADELADALYRLRRKGWLIPIERGKYLVVPRAGTHGWDEHPFLVVEALLSSNYYVSFWTALAHYGLTEQVPSTVFVALTGQRKKAFVFHQQTYRFVTLPTGRFFGWHEIRLGEQTCRIAEVEKALVDALYQEQYGGGIIEITKSLHHARGVADPARLIAYAVQMGSAALCRRLGYLMAVVGWPEAAGLLPYLGRTPKTHLSTVLPHTSASFDERWKLWVNVPKEVLTGWQENG
ncbi:MAG: type IV toxin-antitoxin system AbiEi family antitoxin domain-containing protein [Verrucomicrobia bacterium]|nr:type IV toxin-antitoxin system AbiEi family antitoxin domain-containing protein [Verrucomicrobiota bacterium]